MLKSIGVLLATSAAALLLRAAEPASPLSATFKSAAELAAALHQSMEKRRPVLRDRRE
jgi:hypothetical protein